MGLFGQRSGFSDHMCCRLTLRLFIFDPHIYLLITFQVASESQKLKTGIRRRPNIKILQEQIIWLKTLLSSLCFMIIKDFKTLPLTKPQQFACQTKNLIKFKFHNPYNIFLFCPPCLIVGRLSFVIVCRLSFVVFVICRCLLLFVICCCLLFVVVTN